MRKQCVKLPSADGSEVYANTDYLLPGWNGWNIS